MSCALEHSVKAHLTYSFTDSELSTAKRQLSRALHEIEELKHTNERQTMESTTATNALQAQIKEYVVRMERLERHRAQLLAKDREAEEKEKMRRSEEDGGRAEIQAQARALRQELSTLRDQHAELGAKYRDLEHSSRQAITSAESQSARVAAVERELELARRGAAERATELSEEREKRRALEMELDREKAHRADAANADVVREELHRELSSLRTL